MDQKPIDRPPDPTEAIAAGDEALRIGQVARLARISVRTLHHYDTMGLLHPSGRSVAGYRMYTTADLERLQHILFYRELGFALEEIKESLADPAFDRHEALLAQREMLCRQIARLGSLVEQVDRTLASLEGAFGMSKKEMFEVFGDFDPAEYEEEVEERWGHTEAYKESARRAKGYTKADWRRFKEESEEITSAIADLMDQGVPPDDARAMDAVERHRLQIDRWFYPCSHEMHENLGHMYVADPRFTATYEKIRAGMARYVCDAIAANRRASRGGGA